MKDDTLEHLSSLVDGELSEETGLFVARRMCADSQLGDTWERYHLIRECIRRPGGRLAATRLTLDSGRVTNGGARTAPRWLKPLSGFAIAASVAALAVLVAMPETATGPAATDIAAQPFLSPNSANIRTASQPASLSGGQANQRLNAYLLRHNQLAGSAGRQGFVSLVPMVTTNPVQVLEAQAVPEEPETQDVVAGNQP